MMAANCNRYLDDNPPPSSPNRSPQRMENDVVNENSSSSSHQSQSGRRRRRRNDQRIRRELGSALKRLEKERRMKDKYKKKYYRARMKLNSLGYPSPGEKSERNIKTRT